MVTAGDMALGTGLRLGRGTEGEKSEDGWNTMWEKFMGSRSVSWLCFTIFGCVDRDWFILSVGSVVHHTFS
jgi:hypothetical protein